jgi:hypothetical protein
MERFDLEEAGKIFMFIMRYLILLENFLEYKKFQMKLKFNQRKI